MPQTQSRIDERFLQPGGTKIGRNNNIPGNNALIIGNSNNAFSEENLILGDFNSAAGKAFILGDQNITSDSQVPIFVIGNNNTTPPNSNGIIAGHYMTFSRIFENGYVFGAHGLYQTYSISDFMIFGQPTATQSFTHSQRVYINWDVEFGPDSNVFGLAGSLIGAAGPQGFQGPFGGPQGFVGPTGPQGNIGSIGNTGAQGQFGPTGSQGFQGNTGVQGLIGNTGPQGLIGPTGFGGALGHYGSFYSITSVVGGTISNIPMLSTTYANGVYSDGVDKIFFDNDGVYKLDLSTTLFKTGGNTASQVNVWYSKNGVPGTFSNTSWFIDENYTIIPTVVLEYAITHTYNWIVEVNSGDYLEFLFYTNDNGSSISPVFLEEGPSGAPIKLNVTQVMYTQIGNTGSQGISGQTGSTGSQGFQGPQGQIGNTGSIGNTGPQGLIGNTGSQGFQGPIGLIGNTGSTGPQGISGAIGINGNTGPQGFQGNIGPTGSNGSQGFQGQQGLTGSQGPLASDKGSFGVIFDGLGGVPSIGKTDWVVIPYNGTITGWQIFSGTTGSCVIDVRKDTYGNFPPTAADSIAGTEKPTLVAQLKNQDLSLSTWTASVVSGDIMQFYLESVTSLTKINCVIFIDKN